EERDKKGLDDEVPLIRVEQLDPFPRELLAAELKRFGKDTDVIWCQEEPQNQGTWYQIKHHLEFSLADGQKLHYAGRARAPSPAVGHLNGLVEEQTAVLAGARVNPP